MSVREIARWHGVDEKAIRKRAAAEVWVREKEPGHIRRDEIADAKARQASVGPDVTDRARDLAARMLDELNAVTSMVDELQDMICAEESDPRRRQALLKALSLGDRATTLKNISTALKTLNEAGGGVKARRQANAEKSSAAGRFAAPAGPRLVVSNGE